MEPLIPEQLGALSHPKRLDLFRLLMRRYPNSVPAGQIAQALDLKPNTASVYLSALKQVGLIDQTRVGTSLQYSVNLAQVRGLFGGLLVDCCQNRPDLCLPSSTPTGCIPRPKSQKPLNVLFICTANSARSIMAEAILQTEGKGRFNAYSAGTTPAGTPHPAVLNLLKSKSYDFSGISSKSLNHFEGDSAPQMDFVFTVCDQAANEECPTWPGHPMIAHWGLPDPTKATAAEKELAFQQAYGLLRHRIRAFVSLPIESLDQISLQHNVDDIGRMSATHGPD
ncbi:MAG: protein-tyrosine-phosphatase/DNA-binding transcriptional ArsR family regulator [Paracoccaceae bacterium]|jgi:protein-tyrosine-phosphatase/DNA-binding transcriptional ArsR family regulator